MKPPTAIYARVILEFRYPLARIFLFPLLPLNHLWVSLPKDPLAFGG
jgi:hypothetical protein